MEALQLLDLDKLKQNYPDKFVHEEKDVFPYSSG